MALDKSIRGLTIKLNADTTALGAALADVTKDSQGIAKELGKVNTLLKFSPKSTELLSQKHKLLGDQVGETKNKLDTLKKAEKQAQEQFKRGEISEKQYRALKREVVETESKLKHYKGELKDVTKEKNKFTQGVKKATDGLQSFGKKAGAFAVKGMKGLAIGVGSVAAGMVALTESTREYRDDLSKLEQNAKNAGNDFSFMKGELSYLNAVTGETDSSIEALSNLMAVGFSDAQMTDVVNGLAGAVIKFPDTLKIEGLADGLQETLATGQAVGTFSELIERMGGNVEEFNEQLAGATTEAEKQEVALKWLAESGLADVNEAYAETNRDAIAAKEAQFALTDSLAVLAEVVEPVITKFKEGLVPIIQKLTKWVQDNMPTFQKIIEVAFNKASEVTETLWKWFKDSLWPMLVSVFEWVKENWPTLQETFEAVFGVISEVVKIAWDIFENLLLPTFVKILDWTSENWPVIEAIIKGVFEGIKFVWDNVLEPVLSTLLDIFGDIFDWAEKNFPTMRDTVETVFDAIGTAVDAVVTIFEGLRDAIGWALDKWNDWINRPEDESKSPNQNISGGIRDFIDGTHATGLANVPFDGYIAQLHQGERVLTAQESANLDNIGDQVVRALQDAGFSKPANIYLDGKKVGNGIIRVVDRGLARESSEASIGKGALEW